MDILTPEERQVRLKKADSIRRMLADTGATTGSRNAGKISLNTNLAWSLKVDKCQIITLDFHFSK